MSSTPGQRKHVPLRTCVVCREQAGKRALVRLVRGQTGIILDPSGKMNGRGAYLCDRAECWERALTTDILAKALRTTITSDDRDRLRLARAAQ